MEVPPVSALASPIKLFQMIPSISTERSAVASTMSPSQGPAQLQVGLKRLIDRALQGFYETGRLRRLSVAFPLTCLDCANGYERFFVMLTSI